MTSAAAGFRRRLPFTRADECWNVWIEAGISDVGLL